MTCRLCLSEVGILVAAGLHPVANRFVDSVEVHEERFPLTLVQCPACGVIQLETPVPVAAIAPRFDWITYNEPEGHLDEVTRLLRALPGVGPDSVAAGLTYKDDSTLARLRATGVQTAWRLNAATDLQADGIPGLETVQDRLTPERARAIAARGVVDVLIVRHILEHVYDLRRFAGALRTLVQPNGYLVFEVPDCTQVLDTLDYTTIWEEHLMYFTPPTFREALGRLGFDVVAFESYPYPYENSLVAVARPQGGVAHGMPDLAGECARGARFAAGFDQRRVDIQTFLRDRQRRGHRTAVFGAGHLSCMFINLMDVSREIAFVVDDHPGKRGRLMPGSHLAIRGSDALITERIDLCLSSLSPESEDQVVARQRAYLEQGGQFASIFPASRRALRFSAPSETQETPR